MAKPKPEPLAVTVERTTVFYRGQRRPFRDVYDVVSPLPDGATIKGYSIKAALLSYLRQRYGRPVAMTIVSTRDLPR